MNTLFKKSILSMVGVAGVAFSSGAFAAVNTDQTIYLTDDTKFEDPIDPNATIESPFKAAHIGSSQVIAQRKDNSTWQTFSRTEFDKRYKYNIDTKGTTVNRSASSYKYAYDMTSRAYMYAYDKDFSANTSTGFKVPLGYRKTYVYTSGRITSRDDSGTGRSADSRYSSINYLIRSGDLRAYAYNTRDDRYYSYSSVNWRGPVRVGRTNYYYYSTYRYNKAESTTRVWNYVSIGNSTWNILYNGLRTSYWTKTRNWKEDTSRFYIPSGNRATTSVYLHGGSVYGNNLGVACAYSSMGGASWTHTNYSYLRMTWDARTGTFPKSDCRFLSGSRLANGSSYVPLPISDSTTRYLMSRGSLGMAVTADKDNKINNLMIQDSRSDRLYIYDVSSRRWSTVSADFAGRGSSYQGMTNSILQYVHPRK